MLIILNMTLPNTIQKKTIFLFVFYIYTYIGIGTYTIHSIKKHQFSQYFMPKQNIYTNENKKLYKINCILRL